METVIRSAAIAWAIPSKSPGEEMPSVRMITCLSLATADCKVSCASSMAGAMLVPPPASRPAIRSRMKPLSVQGCSSLTQKFSPSKASTPTLSLGPMQLDGRPRRFLGHLDLLAPHRAGLVDHQHHRQAGLLLLLLEVAPDRQDLFERRLVIAPQAERLVAAEHDQAAAQVPDVGPGHLHLSQAQRGGRDVREDHEVVVLQLGQVIRRPSGRPDVDLHVLLFQRPGQVLGLVGVALDEEHPRLAGGRDQREVAVIVQQRVAVALEPGGDRGQAAQVDRLLEDDAVLARLELDRLVGDLDVAAVDLDAALVVVVVAIDQDLDVERLALEHLGRRVDGRELGLGLGPAGQRDGQHLDLAVHRRGGLEGVAGRGIAVGDQHDPGDVEWRDRRRRHLQRPGQVGPLAIEPLGVGRLRRWSGGCDRGCGLRRRRDAAGFSSAFHGLGAVADAPRLAGERQHGEPVRARVRGRPGQEGVDGLRPLLADALAPVHREDDEQLARRPDEAQAPEGQDQQHHQRTAEQQREHPLPSGEIHQAAVEVVNQARHDGQAQQPPGARSARVGPGTARTALIDPPSLIEEPLPAGQNPGGGQ